VGKQGERTTSRACYRVSSLVRPIRPLAVAAWSRGRTLPAFLVALIGFCVLLAASSAANAQLRPDQAALTNQVNQWWRDLDAAERYVEGGVFNESQHRRHRERIAEIAEQARTANAETEKEIAAASRLVEALGPPPAEGQPPESRDLAAKRAELQSILASWKARKAQTDLVLTRVDEVRQSLSTVSRERRLEELLKRNLTPVTPGVIAVALPQFASIAERMVRSPVVWFESLSEEQRSAFPRWLFWEISLLAAVGLLAYGLRRVVLRRYGPDPADEHPSYTRRFVGALAQAVGNGIVPAGVLGVVYLGATHDVSIVPGIDLSGLFQKVLSALSLASIFFVLTAGFSKAVLAPNLIQWQLTTLDADSVRKLRWRIMLLAIAVAADLFFRLFATGLQPSTELQIFYAFVVGAVEALALMSLMRASVWRTGEPDVQAAPEKPSEKDDEQTEGKRVQHTFWIAIRSVVTTLAVISILASMAGYGRFAHTITDTLVIGAVLFALLFLARGLMHEAVGAVLRSRVMVERLGISFDSRQTLKFWLKAGIDGLLVAVGLYLSAVAAGIPPADLTDWISSFFSGFAIGGVTISLVDIALAMLAFVVVMLVTRLLRQGLDNNVLPRTKLDTGVRNSISVGARYVSVVVALLIAISVLGIDLSNIALVAGALSVGIGFGLQNIVNNFVSGLILLIERPVKVGDWVVVGANEGKVQRISVRATEIETFAGASVILPNSELLSTAVVNWTHRDRFGRLEISVGVAYGSDTEKVKEILLGCAEAHEEVSKWPKPFVVFNNFGANSLDFTLYAYLRDVGNRLTVSSQLRFAINHAFREAGIEIPFGQTDVHIKDLERILEAIRTLRPPAPPAHPPQPAPTSPGDEAPRGTVPPEDAIPSDDSVPTVEKAAPMPPTAPLPTPATPRPRSRPVGRERGNRDP
jgi:small-conductance mechanosensitive channel